TNSAACARKCASGTRVAKMARSEDLAAVLVAVAVTVMSVVVAVSHRVSAVLPGVFLAIGQAPELLITAPWPVAILPIITISRGGTAVHIVLAVRSRVTVISVGVITG